MDKLDGRIDGAFFERMSAEQPYMDEGVQLLELAALQKRRLLNFVLSNNVVEERRAIRDLPATA